MNPGVKNAEVLAVEFDATRGHLFWVRFVTFKAETKKFGLGVTFSQIDIQVNCQRILVAKQSVLTYTVQMFNI